MSVVKRFLQGRFDHLGQEHLLVFKRCPLYKGVRCIKVSVVKRFLQGRFDHMGHEHLPIVEWCLFIEVSVVKRFL